MPIEQDRSPFTSLEKASRHSVKVFTTPSVSHAVIRPNEYLDSSPDKIKRKVKTHKALLDEVATYGVLIPAHVHVVGNKYQALESPHSYASHMVVEKITGLNLDILPGDTVKKHIKDIGTLLQNLIKYHTDKFTTDKPLLMGIETLDQYRLGYSEVSNREGIFLLDLENHYKYKLTAFDKLRMYAYLLTSVRTIEKSSGATLVAQRQELFDGISRVELKERDKNELQYKANIITKLQL